MSDEKQELLPNEEELVAAPTQEPTVLSIDDKARSMGWKPLEEFKGDPDTWVEAKEFVGRRSFFVKIDDLKKQIAMQNQVLKTVNATLSQAEQRAYQEGLEQAKKEMKEARMAGDFQGYEDALQKQSQLLAAQQQKVSPASVTTSVEEIRSSNEWKEFVESGNEWVNGTDVDDKIKQQAASILVTKYEQENPTAARADLLKFVHREIRNKFPNDKAFKESSTVPTVSGVSRGSSSYETSTSLSGLSEAQKQAIQYYQEHKFDTKELLAQFRKAGRK